MPPTICALYTRRPPGATPCLSTSTPCWLAGRRAARSGADGPTSIPNPSLLSHAPASQGFESEQAALETLETMFGDNVGEVVMFQWVEELRNAIADDEDGA